jgi:tetratricopeptide (TPR) repeat protein
VAAITINGTEHDDGTYYYNLGTKLVASGEYVLGINAYDTALSSNTTMLGMSDGLLYVYINKAYAQVKLEMFSDALNTTTEGLALYQNDARLWNNNGDALFGLGRYQDAVTAYKKALTTDPGNPYATEGLARSQKKAAELWNSNGDALFGLGRYQDAVTAYTTALSFDPGNSNATEGLARSQKKAAEISPIMMIVAVIAIVAIIGTGAYYLSRKKAEGTRPETKTETKVSKKK